MIALIMEAVRTAETSVIFNVTTRRYILEDSKFQRSELTTTFWLKISREESLCHLQNLMRPILILITVSSLLVF
jgi:hypothetical protein